MLTHRVLFEEQTIAIRVQEMARAIAQDLPEPTPILIGPNTRVNIQSTDSSTNIVNVEKSALFDALRKSLDASISDYALQQRLREAVDAMQVSAGTRSFSERYKDFIPFRVDTPRLAASSSYRRKPVSRGPDWIPCQARNDGPV